MSKKKLQLLDYQKVHYHNIRKVLDDSYFALDLSLLGLGKTYTSAYLAQNFTYVIVVAPKSVAAKWEEIKKEYHLSNIKWIGTYQATGSKKFPFIINVKADPPQNQTKKKVHPKAEVTPFFDHLLKNPRERVLVIIDELQGIKNKSQQSLRLQSLVHAISVHGKKNKFIGLSASPFDKMEHVERLFQFLNILGPEDNDRPENHILELMRTRIIHYKEEAKMHKKQKPGLITRLFKKAPQTYEEFIFDQFNHIFKKHFVCRMEIPKLKEIQVINGIYPMIQQSNQDQKEFLAAKEALAQLNDLVFNRPSEFRFDTKSLRLLTVYMQVIERAKVFTMCARALHYLETFPTCKVVLVFNFSESVRRAQHFMKSYDPLTLVGATSTHDRKHFTTLFQHSNLRHRVMLGNLVVLNSGIDLDDKYGVYPRFCIANPSWNSIYLYQLNGRFQRIDTKGKALVQYFFLRDVNEQRLLNALSRKKFVLEHALEDQKERGIKFPGDYENVYF